jgi:Uncharacterized conserved protein
MPVLTDGTLKMQLPRMIRVRQKFADISIQDIEKAVRKELEQEKIRTLIKPGQSIAVAVGSRGINNLNKIVKTTINYFKELGAVPFIVPAMGSHGGATAEGQKEILRGYGVTEEDMGVPIKSSMEVTLIGNTPKGIPVYMDTNARAADMVVPINRVKPHTSIKGPIESGLCKMCAIGLGKHIGCSRLHEEGRPDFSNVLTSVAEVFLAKANIGFGLAVVENAFDKTARIKAVGKTEWIEEERKLLVEAKAMMPRLFVPDVDVLVIEQFGKDISGAGMDSNVIGRSITGRLTESVGYTGPQVKRIVVLDFSEGAHGNGSGIGLADFITKKVFDKFDFIATYANAIASDGPEGARIPIAMETEREAILAAVKCCGKMSESGPRIVRIKDTLHLSEILISENMLPLIKGNNRLEIVE